MTLERYLLRRFDSALDRLEAERAFALPDAPEPTARTDEPR
jgi:hypothetical protein